MTKMYKTLRKITSHVRKTKGSGEALRFYVNFIQPIKGYFGGDEEVKKISITTRQELIDLVRFTAGEISHTISDEDAESIVDDFLDTDVIQ